MAFPELERKRYKPFADTLAEVTLAEYAGMRSDFSGQVVQHGVIGGQDAFLSAIAAIRRLVLPPHDGEGVHDVVHGMARRGEVGGEGGAGLPASVPAGGQVDVEEGRVQFGAKCCAPARPVAQANAAREHPKGGNRAENCPESLAPRPGMGKPAYGSAGSLPQQEIPQ